MEKKEDFKSKVAELSRATKSVIDEITGIEKSTRDLSMQRDTLEGMVDRVRKEFHATDEGIRAMKASFEEAKNLEMRAINDKKVNLERLIDTASANVRETEKNRNESIETLKQNMIMLDKNRALQAGLLIKAGKADELLSAIR